MTKQAVRKRTRPRRSVTGDDLPLNPAPATVAPVEGPSFNEEALALANPAALPGPLRSCPWEAGLAVDGRGVLANGIKYRIRVEPLPECSFVAWDLLDGPWDLRQFGLKEGDDFIDVLRQAWPANAWVRFNRRGLFGFVPNAYVVLLLQFMQTLLSDDQYAAWLGMDSTLEPVVPYHPLDGAALRTEARALEPE